MKILIIIFAVMTLVSCTKESVETTPAKVNNDVLKVEKDTTGKKADKYKVQLQRKDGKVDKKGQKFHGVYEKFYENGQKMFEYTYKNGKLVNLEGWDRNGNHCIVSGTGKITFYNTEGGIISSMSYKNSKLHDTLTKYYPNGRKESEQYFDEGTIIGTTNWDENGKADYTKITVKSK